MSSINFMHIRLRISRIRDYIYIYLIRIEHERKKKWTETLNISFMWETINSFMQSFRATMKKEYTYIERKINQIKNQISVALINTNLS